MNNRHGGSFPLLDFSQKVYIYFYLSLHQKVLAFIQRNFKPLRMCWTWKFSQKPWFSLYWLRACTSRKLPEQTWGASVNSVNKDISPKWFHHNHQNEKTNWLYNGILLADVFYNSFTLSALRRRGRKHEMRISYRRGRFLPGVLMMWSVEHHG